MRHEKNSSVSDAPKKELETEANKLNVEVICRLNQARSIVSEIYIEKVFEMVSANSSGVCAEENRTFPNHTLRLLEESGLSLKKKSPERSSNRINRIQNADILIFSETYMRESIGSYVHDHQRTITLTECSDSPMLKSQDPALFGYHAFKNEVIKNVAQSVSEVQRILYPKTEHALRVIVPKFESSESSAYRLALDLNSESRGLLISLNYRSPAIRSMIPFDVRTRSLLNFLNVRNDKGMNDISKTMVMQNHEVPDFRDLILSQSYRNAVRLMLSRVPVTVFTEPANVHDRSNSNASISSIYADEILIVE
jgi:protein-tyrosine-phosphatase